MNVIPISGKDSLAAALVQTAHEPSDYRFFFNDTGVELPETYEWLDRVERVTGWTIERVGKDLVEIIEFKQILPSQRVRFCTTDSKIKPMEQWLGTGEFNVYFGIRADENRIGYKPLSKKCQITPRYPLQEHGINLGGVYAILQGKDLLPPAFYWQSLENKVDELWAQNPSMWGDWRDFVSFHEKRLLFAGRTRNNCYFCFFQRKYEFCWLSETHPDLFAKAVEMEETIGGDGFTWCDQPLLEIAKKKEHYITRRANEIIKYINGKIYQTIVNISSDNELSNTSCGLFCGK